MDLGQRVPLKVEKPPIDLRLNEREQQALNILQDEISQTIWKWKNVQISLPPSQLSEVPQIDLGALIQPNSDLGSELRQIAVDPTTNEVRSLSWDQCWEIRREGELKIPSISFPAQNHVWRLNELLQKGTERTWHSLLENLSSGFEFIVIFLPDLLYLSDYSVTTCVTTMFETLFYDLPDLFFGLPAYQQLQRSINDAKTFHLLQDGEFRLIPTRSNSGTAKEIKFIDSNQKEYKLDYVGENKSIRGHFFSSLHEKGVSLNEIKDFFQELSRVNSDLNTLFRVVVPHPFTLKRQVGRKSKKEKRSDSIPPLLEQTDREMTETVDLRPFFLGSCVSTKKLQTKLESLFDQEWSSNLKRLREHWFEIQLTKPTELEPGPSSSNEEDGEETEDTFLEKNKILLLIRLIRQLSASQHANEFPELDEFAETLIGFIKVCVIIRKNELKEAQERDRRQKEFRVNLRHDHPLLSLIDEWSSRKEHEFQKKENQKYHYYVYRHTLAQLQQTRGQRTESVADGGGWSFTEEWNREMSFIEKESQWSYLIEKSIQFETEHEKKVTEQLLYSTTPLEITFSRRIWRPSHWKITRSKTIDGETKKDGYLASDYEKYMKPESEGYSYSLNKNESYKVKTNHFGWRWTCVLIGMIFYASDILFWSFVSLFVGPYSLKALFAREPYFPDRVIRQRTGDITQSQHPKITPFVQRIDDLWSNISASRREFEQEPDTSIIGKTMTRKFNQIWNYLFKGFFGTLILFLFYPMMTILNTLGSLFFMATFILWGIVAGLGGYVVHLLIEEHNEFYDRRWSRFPLLDLIIWRLMMKGVGLMLVDLLGIMSCPLVFGLIFILSWMRWIIRSIHDFLLFWLILVPKGRIPATNSFLVKRIRGPGLSSTIYSRAPKELVIVTVQRYLEQMEERIYKERLEELFGEPLQDHQRHLKMILTSLGDPNPSIPNDENLAQLVRNRQGLEKRLKEYLQEREGERRLKGEVRNKARMKMSAEDLAETIEMISSLVEQFFEERLLPLVRIRINDQWNRKQKLKEIVKEDVEREGRKETEAGEEEEKLIIKTREISEEEFFKNQFEQFWKKESPGVAQRDWLNLGKEILKNTWGDSFLDPLELSDQYHSLEVQHINGLKGFTSMIIKNAPRDDLQSTVVRQNKPTNQRSQPLLFPALLSFLTWDSTIERQIAHNSWIPKWESVRKVVLFNLMPSIERDLPNPSTQIPSSSAVPTPSTGEESLGSSQLGYEIV